MRLGTLYTEREFMYVHLISTSSPPAVAASEKYNFIWDILTNLYIVVKRALSRSSCVLSLSWDNLTLFWVSLLLLVWAIPEIFFAIFFPWNFRALRVNNTRNVLISFLETVNSLELQLRYVNVHFVRFNCEHGLGRQQQRRRRRQICLIYHHQIWWALQEVSHLIEYNVLSSIRVNKIVFTASPEMEKDLCSNSWEWKLAERGEWWKEKRILVSFVHFLFSPASMVSVGSF